MAIGGGIRFAWENLAAIRDLLMVTRPRAYPANRPHQGQYIGAATNPKPNGITDLSCLWIPVNSFTSAPRRESKVRPGYV